MMCPGRSWALWLYIQIAHTSAVGALHLPRNCTQSETRCWSGPSRCWVCTFLRYLLRGLHTPTSWLVRWLHLVLPHIASWRHPYLRSKGIQLSASPQSAAFPSCAPDMCSSRLAIWPAAHSLHSYPQTTSGLHRNSSRWWIRSLRVASSEAPGHRWCWPGWTASRMSMWYSCLQCRKWWSWQLWTSRRGCFPAGSASAGYCPNPKSRGSRCCLGLWCHFS